MSLLTYKEARPWAAAIKQAVVTGKMPPWKADPALRQVVERRPPFAMPRRTRSSPGSMARNPKAIPRTCRPRPSFRTAGRSASPTLSSPFRSTSSTATGPDEYIYITVPTNFTEDKWVTAAELRPGNRRDRPSRPCLRSRAGNEDRKRTPSRQSGAGIHQVAADPRRLADLYSPRCTGHQRRLLCRTITASFPAVTRPISEPDRFLSAGPRAGCLSRKAPRA